MTTDNYLLQFCRYFKGEGSNPFSRPSLRFWIWEFEKQYVGASAETQQLSPFLQDALERYRRAGLTGFEKADGIPVFLKATLYMLFLKGNELPLNDEFYRFYDQWKKRKVER